MEYKFSTTSAINFIDKVKLDFSDESIASGLDSLTFDELTTLRNFLAKLETHTVDRIYNYDLNRFCQERKIETLKDKAQRDFEHFAIRNAGES